MNWIDYQSKIEEIEHPLLKQKNIKLSILREDMIHTSISGNKYRKLKYNLIKAKELGFTKLITFGGAFSNHIAATAAAANLTAMEVIGFIRGEEVEQLIDSNPTLSFAKHQGMKFKFMSRAEYRLKDTPEFIQALQQQYPDHYIIPEGGTNALAIQGCEEILHPACHEYQYIGCAIGTGGTITGLINSSLNEQTVLGFPALKGEFFSEEICKLTIKRNFKILTSYHFGGYGKVSEELINFINSFKSQTHIPLDPIYTGKMVYGLFDLINKDFFPVNTKILAIHTGGLQGIEGINKQLKKKNKTIIQ